MERVRSITPSHGLHICRKLKFTSAWLYPIDLRINMRKKTENFTIHYPPKLEEVLFSCLFFASSMKFLQYHKTCISPPFPTCKRKTPSCIPNHVDINLTKTKRQHKPRRHHFKSFSCQVAATHEQTQQKKKNKFINGLKELSNCIWNCGRVT